MATRTYYIYFHINPIKNEIFYVGKGNYTNRKKYSRSKTSYNRSKFWHNIVSKYGYIVNIIEDKLTEKEAFNREVFYVNKIGRRDLNNGNLVNHTDGGGGTTNHILTKESKILMGIKPEGWYENLSKFNKNAFNIKITQYDLNGNFIKLWESAKEAFKITKAYHICKVCKGERKSSGGYMWKYVKKGGDYRN